MIGGVMASATDDTDFGKCPGMSPEVGALVRPPDDLVGRQTVSKASALPVLR